MGTTWIESVASAVEAHVRQTKGDGAHIICSSGISPSGPIHLGNLREVMTVHLVAEELRRRGRAVEHIHFWDDYDRLRKVPAGMQESLRTSLGCPLSDVPDPFGVYASYAERYASEFEEGLAQIGIQPRYVRQSVAYRTGTYTAQIKHAIAQRSAIFDVLAEYQTRQGQQASADLRRGGYFPYRPYCAACHKDTTVVRCYDAAEALVQYACESCGHEGSGRLDDCIEGKLVWKVDWPMRWSAYAVDFEPAGADHASPGGSFAVGKQIVQDVYGSPAPYFVGYAFVGMAGRAKISSSVGTNATLTAALDIIEPCILRWLYARRSYQQAFDIDFGQGLLRLYDEWDSFATKARLVDAEEDTRRLFQAATTTSSGSLAYTAASLPFRTMTSIVDLTQANQAQILRIASAHLDVDHIDRTRLEPRLHCAISWVTRYEPEDERTMIRPGFSADTYEQLSDENRHGISMLVDRLDESWTLPGLTSLLYSIPKLVRGLPADAQPTPEVKLAQRGFFVALYSLLCGSDTGPRLPTLLLSLGLEHVRRLLATG